MTPLLHAVQEGNLPIVNLLLEEGANIRASNKQHRNMFHLAAESGQKVILQKLIQIARIKGVIKELINAQDLFLGQERCFVVRGRDRGDAAFHYVEVHRWLMSAFKSITQAGGNVDVAKYGTPILSGWGVNPGPSHVKKIEARYSLNHINQRTPKDLTPLNLSIMKSKFDCSELILQTLVEENVSLCIPDRFDLQPIHMAAMRGSLHVVALLEKQGIALDSLTGEGHSASVIADLNNHSSVVNFIKGKDIISSPNVTVSVYAHNADLFN